MSEGRDDGTSPAAPERDRNMRAEPRKSKRARERTCVGCGRHDDPSALVRLVVDSGSPASPDDHEDLGVAFDLAGGAFGRGAHVHPRPDCLAKAPRGIARAFHRPPIPALQLGRRLVEACDRSMAGLLVTARRIRALAVGADAAFGALARGAPLLVVAADAGTVAGKQQVQTAIAEGRAVSWRTKVELGALLGEGEVALCALEHEAIAAKFKSLRAAADAGASVIREGEGCSTEAR